MTPLLLVMLAGAPCVYWTQGIESRAALEAAGIRKICVPPGMVDTWKAAGFTVSALTDADLASRQALPVPGVTARAGLASPTRSPWIVASGWRIARRPGEKYAYTLPAGKAGLAAAEAFAYGADAVLTVDPADLASLGAMMAFLDGLPPLDLPPVADLGVVDDRSEITGEVMNLLVRRNLLFEIVPASSSKHRVNVAVGTTAYPQQEAADPSAFAQKIRGQLTDEQRSLRVFGSEVVIGRLTSDGTRARLHLINYGGRDIEGLRIRVRGPYRGGQAYVAGTGRVDLVDQAVADGTIEFSLPRIGTYAVVDLK